MASDNKGIWIALYVFGGLKVAVGLVLMIVGIILMAHEPRDCAEITNCYKEKGIDKCSWVYDDDRRLSETNYSQPWDLDLEGPQSHLPRAQHYATDILGVNRMALQANPAKFLKGQSQSGRQLAEDYDGKQCYTVYKDCDKDMESMSTEAGNWGTSLLVIGLIGQISGGVSILSARKKQKVWLGISMAVDIVMDIVCVAMWFLCAVIAGLMKVICDHINEEAAKNDKDCWEDFIGDVCSWADLFGTATIMFLIMFLVMLCASIVDCGACCCCVPADASWNVNNVNQQQAQAVGQPVVAGAVVGKPVMETNAPM